MNKLHHLMSAVYDRACRLKTLSAAVFNCSIVIWQCVGRVCMCIHRPCVTLTATITSSQMLSCYAAAIGAGVVLAS